MRCQKIARGEISADELEAWEHGPPWLGAGRPSLEQNDKINPFGTAVTLEIRRKQIAGEITAEEAVAAIEAEIKRLAE